jgi:hypothetical protein
VVVALARKKGGYDGSTMVGGEDDVIAEMEEEVVDAEA